jgi:hypothetical protein
MTMHDSLYVYRDFFYLKIAVALAGLSILAYAFYNPIGGHNGGTWLGYALGTIGAGLIVWLMLFGLRKRSYGPGNWRLQAWLSGHVYFGLSLIIVATLHTGFQFGWNIHTLAYVLMMLVILSGVFGIYAYARFPRVMTENRAGQTVTTMFQEIAELDRQCREACLNLPDEYQRAVQQSQNETIIGGGVRRQLAGRDPNCGTTRALATLRDLARSMGSEQAAAAGQLLIAMSKKAELVARARRDVRYKAMMEIWLYFHVPITFALIASLIAHIVSVFFYW